MSLPFALAAWHWLALGVVLAALEIMLPGAVLIWFGAAAICVGLLLALLPEMSAGAQLLLFAALAPIWLGAGLWWRRRAKQTKSEPVNIGAQRLVGQRGRLETAIENGRGEMRLGDTVWPVSGPDLPQGTSVTVTGADGALLKVEASP